MSYYLSYNPSIGNSLVALSDAPIPEQDGLVIEVHEGDIPDLSRYAWNGAILQWYEKRRRRITKLEYMNRFSDIELKDIYSAAKVSVAVEVWLAKFNATTPDPDGTAIDLDDPRVSGGLIALESSGILAAGRTLEIVGA